MNYPGNIRLEASLRQNVYFDAQIIELRHLQEVFQRQIDNFNDCPGQTLYYFNKWPESIEVGGTTMESGMQRFFVSRSQIGEKLSWWLGTYHLERFEQLEFSIYLGGTNIPVFREKKK